MPRQLDPTGNEKMVKIRQSSDYFPGKKRDHKHKPLNPQIFLYTESILSFSTN